MKRQGNLDDFFSKSIKITKNPEQQAENITNSNQTKQVKEKNDTSEVQHQSEKAGTSRDAALLHFWNDKQLNYFKTKYEWLIVVSDENVGCQWCSKVESLNLETAKHLHISVEWKSCSVKAHGSNKENLQSSMRKKLKEHNESASHKKAGEIIKIGETNIISKSFDVANEKYLNSTVNIFNTIYFIIKNNYPFSDFKKLIDLQKKNNVEFGFSLHSRFIVPLVAKLISTEIRRIIFGKLINTGCKISIIIDEASTVSHKSVLVVYLKSEIQDSDDSVTVFIDLVELEGTTSEIIFKTLISVLEKHGFNEKYLHENLIGFCSDGASVMLGKKAGVSARILEHFQGISICHCLAHRIQLTLDDVIKEVNEVNNFRYFLDKLYSYYHTSNKHQRELNNVSKELGTEVHKIGRIFGPRWAACSARTAKAVWKSYQALYIHFSQNKEIGIMSYFKNENFLKDLGLINDILEEISVLSTALQERDISLIRADRLIRRTINLFQHLKLNKGTYEKEADDIIKTKKYNIPFEINRKKTSIVVSRDKFFDCLEKHMKTRLLLDDKNENYNNLLNCFNLLNPETWPGDIFEAPWIEGENRLEQLNKIIKYIIPVNDFRDFVDVRDRESKNINTILRAKRILNVIAVNCAEAERGFSTMRNIIYDKRNSLLIETISHLMTINLMGKSIEDFDATPYVKLWLREGHHMASDKRVKAAAPNLPSQNQNLIWKLFN